MSVRIQCPQCDADPSDTMISMHSGVNHKNEGFIHLFWGQLRAQLTPAEVRSHALGLLEAAEAAESDSMVLRLLVDKIGIDREKAFQIVGDLRNYRDDKYRKK